MSSNKSMTGSIALTKLVHTKYTTKKGAECLLIPIDANKLERDDKGNVYLPARVIVFPEKNEHGQDGLISKMIGSTNYKKLTDAEKEELKNNQSELSKKQTPILGNIKEWSSNNSDNTGQATSTAISEGEEPDDLPF